MSNHAAPRRRSLWRAIRSTRVRPLLSLGIVLGFGSVSTLAYWTDQATVSGMTFTAGTLDLQINGEIDDDYAFTTLGLTDMIPGSSKAAMLPVQNKSVGAKLSFTMTGGASGALGAALKLRLYSGGTASNNGGVGTCNGAAFGGEVSLTSTTTTPIIVTPRGPLDAGTGVEDLCFRVELPSTVNDNSLQTTSSTATFTFTATSVAP